MFKVSAVHVKIDVEWMSAHVTARDVLRHGQQGLDPMPQPSVGAPFRSRLWPQRESQDIPGHSTEVQAACKRATKFVCVVTTSRFTKSLRRPHREKIQWFEIRRS
ncbi:hypothetical protein TNCV_2505191 [Trichonephila clavipes]|uniref:Uncharacterized protein n=1 Tax=Trichonephila clavipes TaxID=2585209 RepID=A0A8X7BJL4_TRICX|nr:hypothetical protein TNCV_2505191 [Trichonephila clavipes]